MTNNNNDEQEFVQIDQEDMINFIFEEMTSQGIFIRREDIEIVFDLHFLYMIEKGFGTIIDDEDYEEE